MSRFEIDLDGALIRGESDGIGIPVIMLHAGVADRRMWAGQIGDLIAAGYHVVAYDRRGHGETESPDVPFSDVLDLEAVLDRLSIHAAVLVGCSMGGALALDFALEHPERTIGLVLVSTAITGAEGEEAPEEAQALEDALAYARERGNLESANRIQAHIWLDGPLSKAGRVEGPIRDLFLDMNGAVLRHRALAGREEPDPAIDHVGTITAPVLLVAGELDYPDVLALHDDLSEELENAFAVVLEETAHLPNLERPDLFNPLLLEFLDAVTGQNDDLDEDVDLEEAAREGDRGH